MPRTVITLSSSFHDQLYLALEAESVIRWLPDEQQREAKLLEAVQVIDRIACGEGGSRLPQVSGIITEEDMNEALNQGFWSNSRRVKEIDNPFLICVEKCIPPSVWEWLLRFLTDMEALPNQDKIVNWHDRYERSVKSPLSNS